MPQFTQHGSMIQVTNDLNAKHYQQLPAGNYVVKVAPFIGWHLEIADPFEMPERLYGKVHQDAQRILNTYQQRSLSTGAMLIGAKGTGKSLCCKQICRLAAATGLPTLLVNTPHVGDEFNQFLQQCSPAVILFDEFEKVYGVANANHEKSPQERLLTLLDGVYPMHSLFLFTVNDRYKLNDYLTNRPGRVHYLLEFDELERDFIVEYCEEHLQALQHIESVCRVATLFSKFSFDLLQAIVEEMNRYGETAAEVLRYLNAKPEGRTGMYEIIACEWEGRKLYQSQRWNGSPMSNISSDLMFHLRPNEANEGEGEGRTTWEEISFGIGDLIGLDAREGRYEYRNSAGDTLTLVALKNRREYDLDRIIGPVEQLAF